MAGGRFVSYLRVSTDKQGRSGLGLEAQRTAVAGFLNGGRWELVAEFVEIETGKRADRPVLAQALAACRLHRAVLVIAKLDRLSRDAHFLLGLEKAGVDFVAADMPNANRLTVGIMAMVAEEERRLISRRTKEALVAAKARGVVLGGDRGYRPAAGATAPAIAAVREQADARAADILPAIKQLQESGCSSLHALARGLNAQGIPTARGSGQWRAAQVACVLRRA